MTTPPLPIPYLPPEHVRKAVQAGLLRVVGATIRDENNVVRAHMVQAGSRIVRDTLNGGQLGPVGAILGLASSAANNVQSAVLQKTVNNLRLISTVGTVASVANVGVSVVGFAAVLNRLEKIEGKLDQVLAGFEAMHHILSQVGVKLETLSLAKLKTMAQQLSIAEAAADEALRRDHLLTAAKGFAELRSYYALLLGAEPMTQYDLPLRGALEAYARFTAAALGELKARLMLGDVPAYRRAAEQVADDAARLMSLKPTAVYRARHSGAAARGPAAILEFCPRGLESEIAKACADLSVTKELLQGEIHVADYLQQNGLAPARYLKALEEFEGGEIVILPIGG